jgi:molybdate transport system substrate-binding protein
MAPCRKQIYQRRVWNGQPNLPKFARWADGGGEACRAARTLEINLMSIQQIPSSHLRILSAGAMHPIIDELRGTLQHIAGKPVAVEFTNSGGVKARVRAGELADVVLTTAAAIDDLRRHDKILPDTATAVARSSIGVAVRAGAARPDIGSVESFKRTLRDASSIAIADPATGSPSGNHLVGVFEQLGMTAELRGKIKRVGGGASGVVVVGDVVASGQAEIGLQQIAEILGVPGLDLVGEIPPELQHVTVFSAAVAATATDVPSARRLVAFLASPQAAAVIEARGMRPAQSEPDRPTR